MIKLYHGTNVDFAEVDLDKCLPYKDFGKGFYLTPSMRRAKLRALDKVEKEHYGLPVVIAYLFENNSVDGLDVLEFMRCDEKWLDFILKNRSRRTSFSHNYDIVSGPVADDGVITSISLYEAGVISRDELLFRLKSVTPYIQYAFCTKKAIEKLSRI